MDLSDAYRKFRWQDKGGIVWNVNVVREGLGVSWYVGLNGSQYPYGKAYVRMCDFGTLRKLSVAYLTDIRVDPRVENRGMGSMLIKEIIDECKRRRFKGIEGHLSEADRDHFDKLEHLYENLGFAVVIYPPGHPGHGTARAGKIEMAF